VAVADAIPKARDAVGRLKAKSAANEANTKAHVIEPTLAALGWDVLDIDVVAREVKVFEGTFLDYALKLVGAPRIYVEAKGAGENLDDKKFIAQAINYANNDGVLWCVLTNGVRWRVYKTNEPVAMDQKLLFEVDLADESEPTAEKARLLNLISRTAVEAGELDSFGERVFTDARVRKALAELAADPPTPLMDAIAAKLGPPAVPAGTVRRSLARILDATTPPEPVPQPGPVKPAQAPAGPAVPPKGQEYPLDHHLGNKSSLIRELFEELDNFASTLGADVSRRSRKQYIGYFRGKRSYFTAEIQHRRVLVYLSLDPKTVQPWNDDAMRDASNIGHFGMGDTEFSLRTVDQLGEVRALIKTAYEAT